MSNSPRRAKPRIKSSPDYQLRITSPGGVTGLHAGGAKFRGAGLASAVRALRKRGYAVEKLPC